MVMACYNLHVYFTHKATVSQMTTGILQKYDKSGHRAEELDKEGESKAQNLMFAS